jgi:hypothetical protein
MLNGKFLRHMTFLAPVVTFFIPLTSFDMG